VKRLSVVIPTYGRPQELERALAALPERLDVIVVADARESSPPPGALQAERPGASAARNTGWRAAEGEVVLFLGDDVIAGAGLIHAHAAAHTEHPAEETAVLGLVEWAEELQATPFMRFLDRGYQFDYGKLAPGEVGWWALYTANVSLKRSFLERCGGFDEDGFPFLYEDLELGYRLSKLGLQLFYVPDARAEHLHAPTLSEYRDRMRIVGAAERRMTEKHPEFEPYFKNQFEAVLAEKRPAGLSGRLVGLAPDNPRVKASAEARWRYALAEAFMKGWGQD
jgi:GT2 family glycosyltransferase